MFEQFGSIHVAAMLMYAWTNYRKYDLLVHYVHVCDHVLTPNANDVFCCCSAITLIIDIVFYIPQLFESVVLVIASLL
jgi:hypothetical protein